MAGLPDDQVPTTGNVVISTSSARLPERLGVGVYSTGAILLGAGSETVLDFLHNTDGRTHVVTRVILPNHVVARFEKMLDQHLPASPTESPDAPQPPNLAPAPHIGTSETGDAPLPPEAASEANPGLVTGANGTSGSESPPTLATRQPKTWEVRPLPTRLNKQPRAQILLPTARVSPTCPLQAI